MSGNKRPPEPSAVDAAAEFDDEDDDDGDGGGWDDTEVVDHDEAVRSTSLVVDQDGDSVMKPVVQQPVILDDGAPVAVGVGSGDIAGAMESEDSGDSCDDAKVSEGNKLDHSRPLKRVKLYRLPVSGSGDMSETDVGPVYLHRWIDCQDYLGQWYESQISQIDEGKSTESETELAMAQRIKVHFKGWNTKFDEWIDLRTPGERARLSKLHRHTEIPINGYRKAAYGIITPEEKSSSAISKGSEIDCLDSANKWFVAKVIDENEYLFRVTYIGWPDSYDEWIDRDSYRIAPLHKFTDAKDPKCVGPAARGKFADSSSSKGEKGEYSGSAMSSGSAAGSVAGMSSSEAFRMQYLAAFKPSLDDERGFRELLRTSKGWIIQDMGGDGSCLFRSISHQIYGTQDCHLMLRQKCVDYMMAEREFFAAFISMPFDEYCAHMARPGVWGGNIEIQIFSEMFQCPINIYAYSDTPMRTFNEMTSERGRVIRLSYHFNSHYNSIVDPTTFDDTIQDPATAGLFFDYDYIYLCPFLGGYLFLFFLECHLGSEEDEAIERLRRGEGRAIVASDAAPGAGSSAAMISEQQQIQRAINESRQIFEKNGNTAQSDIDAAIQASLNTATPTEVSDIDKAIAASLDDSVTASVVAAADEQVMQQSREEYEAEEMRKAMAASLSTSDVTSAGSMMSSASSLPDSAVMTAVGVPTAVQKVIRMGFDEMTVMTGYTLFADQGLSEELLVERLLEYCQQTVQQSELFG